MMMSSEDRFIDAARTHGLATRQGNPVAANGAHDDLVLALQDLRRTPDRGVEFLRCELGNEDASVAAWAALYLLPFKEKEASEALQRVAAQDIPRISFGAEMVLQEWQAGRLEVE
jgi:hypothetical protein